MSEELTIQKNVPWNNLYDSTVKLKEAISIVPGIYGVTNPDFTKKWRRERQLNEIGI